MIQPLPPQRPDEPAVPFVPFADSDTRSPPARHSASLSERGDPDPAARPREDESAQGSDVAPGRRVLLVDDDDDFRRIFGNGLQANGFDVTAAASAEEALERAAVEPGVFHAVVMDIELGDGWGASVAVQLRQHQPDIKVVFVSGYVRNDPVLREAIQEHMTFLEKPFLIHDLVRVLDQVLSE